MSLLRCGNKTRAIAIAVVLLGISVLSAVLVSGRFNRIGARLVSVSPLPETDGEMCQWIPASASTSMISSLSAEREADGVAENRPSEALKAAAAKRKPIRMLGDKGLAFAGIAVDPVRDEVVMTDENLFSILVYDRLENTPPRASMSEPKRMIRGLQTKLEFNCGIYVDPASGDIYSPNNDSVHALVVFNRNAKGDVPPSRQLVIPHSTFGIAVDEQNQEMFITVQDDEAVMVWKKNAKNEDVPVRIIQGQHTQMADPHGVAVDSKNGLLFVANWGTTNDRPNHDGSLKRYDNGPKEWPVAINQAYPGSGKIMPPSITVYPKEASGDTAPLRVIQGPKTQLNWPTAISVDPEHGEIFVANDTADTVAVYSVTTQGDAEPIRVIKGPKSLIKNPTGVSYDAKNDELWVSNFGNHTAAVYKRTASGDTPPLRVIRSAPQNSPTPMMGNPYNVGYDSKREEILVASCVAHPQIASFARTAEGAANATRSIAGQNTLITRQLHGLAYDSAHDEIVIPQYYAMAVLTFRGDAKGNVAPLRKIFGPHTQLYNPDKVTVDPIHSEIFVPQEDSVLVFDRNADGDMAPKRILKGPDTQIRGGGPVAVDPVHDLLVLTCCGPGGPKGNQGSPRLMIYDRNASGNTKPLRVISGPNSGVLRPMGLTTYGPKGLILTADLGTRGAAGNFVGVWSIFDNGDAPPRWTIGGPNGMLVNIRGVEVDPKHKSVLISDKNLNAVLTYEFPEIF